MYKSSCCTKGSREKVGRKWRPFPGTIWEDRMESEVCVLLMPWPRFQSPCQTSSIDQNNPCFCLGYSSVNMSRCMAKLSATSTLVKSLFRTAASTTARPPIGLDQQRIRPDWISMVTAFSAWFATIHKQGDIVLICSPWKPNQKSRNCTPCICMLATVEEKMTKQKTILFFLSF